MNTQRWFHSSLLEEDAENLLLEQGQDGSFVVRPSSSNQADPTLTVRRGNEIVHMKIQRNKGFFDLYGGHKFSNLTDLLQYYMNNDLHEENGGIIRLKTPLNCAEFTKKHWYHGQMSSEDASNILLRYGMDGSFLVRDATKLPGQFVITVRVCNRVKHILIHILNGEYDLGGGTQFDDLDSLIEHYQIYPLVETTGDVFRLKHPFNTTTIHVQNFHARVNQLQEESQDLGYVDNKQGFLEEFETLQKSSNEIKEEIILDFTRVTLKDIGFDAAGSYHIDANFIRYDSNHVTDELDLSSKETRKLSTVPTFQTRVLPQDPIYANIPIPKPKKETEIVITEHVYNKTYIATQDCLSTNNYPFWSMVWQEDVRIIVMMTKDDNRQWPELHKTEVIEKNIIIYKESESVMPYYTLRRFLLKKKDEEKTVFYFNFTAWGDVTPAPGRLLNLLFDVNYKLEEIMSGFNAPSQTVVCVHCRTGTGRSAAFIVIDMIVDHIRRDGFDSVIDIRNIVQLTRDQRSGMVENVAQYEFIYMTVLEFIETVKQRNDLA